MQWAALRAAVYGAVSELMPIARTGAGLPFGAAVWLVADDIVVPALGLSKPVSEYPISKNVYALVSHFLFMVSRPKPSEVLSEIYCKYALITYDVISANRAPANVVFVSIFPMNTSAMSAATFGKS